MRRWGVAVALLGVACGAKSGLAGGGAADAPVDAGLGGASDGGLVEDAFFEDVVYAGDVVGRDAGDARDAEDAGGGRDAGVEAGAPFACGDVPCEDSATQYCLVQEPGCEAQGQACTSSGDCCSGMCADGICGGPGVEGGPGPSYTCVALPADCRISPPTCECVLAHAPCAGFGPGPIVPCTESGGVVTVTCPGE